MLRTMLKRSGGWRTRFAPDLLPLEDRSVPASIYVDPDFTGTAGGPPGQDFSGGGPLASVPASQLTFVPAGSSASITGTGKFATADVTTAFNAARDNPGDDTIFLAGSTTPYLLDNSQGGSLSATYFFNGGATGGNLSVLGAGIGASTLKATASTADVDTSATDPGAFDPVLAIRLGATFTASDFTFDGSGAAVGIGAAVGASGTSKLAITRVAFQNFVFNDGSTNGGATRGSAVLGLENGGSTGDQITLRDSTFTNIGRAAVSLTNSIGQVLGGTFTGSGAGDRVQYGVQAQGSSLVYVSGATFTGFTGVASGDGTESAGLISAQDVDLNGNPVAGGATILAVTNKIAGNKIGAAVAGATGSATSGPDGTSKIVANFNDLSANAIGLDGTNALGTGTTGTTSGIDGRFNFFGAGGPNRGATNPVNGQPNDTGATGDELLNPSGTGSPAVGNVSIGGFRTAAIAPTTIENPTFVATPSDTAGAAATAKSLFIGAGTGLIIYVNGTGAKFTDADNSGGAPDQDFNSGGDGPLGTVAKGQLTFFPSGTTFGTGGVTAANTAGTAGKIAVPDLTTALNIARDNPGADVINLAASETPFALDNSQGQSTQFGGFNDNTYFFNDSPLSLNGSGIGRTLILPLVGTVDPNDPATQFDPVIAFRNGVADFTGSDFTFDGSLGAFGGGLAASGGTDVTLTRVALRNFVAVEGAANGGASLGYGLFVNNAPGTNSQTTITDSQFSGNGRVGAQLTNGDGQVAGSSFTGRGVGNRVDYGIQAVGTAKLFVTGSRFSGFQGQASQDGTQSAGISVTQDVDENKVAVAGGAQLLAVGNKFSANRIAVAAQNVDAAGTSTADVRFNDFANNLFSLDTSGGAGGVINAPNNFFGDPAGPTGPNGSDTAGANITVSDIRIVTAPTISVASAFGTGGSGGPTLATAAPLAAQAYVTDPRVQSPAVISPGTTAANGDVTFTVQFADRLVSQDKTLFSATFTPIGGTTQTFTSGQLTISAPVDSGNGSAVTVTVPAGLLTGGPRGAVTLTLAPSSGSAGTGNAQLTVNGFQTGGDVESVQSGTVNSGPVINPNPGPTLVLTPTTPTQTATFTVTFPAGVTGATVTNVTATSNNAAVTVTRVPGSPNEAPQFTVTSTSNNPGTAIITVTASDNDTTSPDTSTAFGVQFGVANTGPTLTVNTPADGSLEVPLGGTGTVTLTAAGSGGRTIVSTALDTSANNFAGVTVTQTGSATNPTFTVTATSTTPASGTLTFITRDSDGLTARQTVFVQVGNTGGVTVGTIGGLQFPTNGGPQTVGTTVSFPNGSGTVTFTNSTPGLFTVTQGGTSTSPTFTVTPVAGQTGSGVVTITARDAGGATSSTSFGVQVGNTVTSNISGVPTTTQVIPFNRSQDFPVSVTGIGAVTLTGTSSNPGVASVTITGTGQNRVVRVTANPTLTTGGVTTITLNSVDANNQQSSASFTVQVAPQRQRRFAAGVGPGESPVVQVYGPNGERLFGFTAFELSFTGGVSVATGDVNGDGVDDIVAGASIGGGPRVRVIDGVDGNELANFFAFEESFRNGVTVAVGKLIDTGTTPDGFFREQIIVGAGDGGSPRVSSFDVLPGKGATPNRLNNFFAFEESFRNGVTVAAGDLTGDGIAEIVTGAGVGGGPRVRAFNAAGSPAGVDFFAFDAAYRGGVNVAVGQLDGTGKGSIIVGTGPNGGSLVRVFSPAGTQVTQFAAYPDASTSPIAVRVASAQFNASGPESIVTGPGVGGGPQIKVFGGTNPGAGAVFSDFSFEQPFRGGIFVG